MTVSVSDASVRSVAAADSTAVVSNVMNTAELGGDLNRRSGTSGRKSFSGRTGSSAKLTLLMPGKSAQGSRLSYQPCSKAAATQPALFGSGGVGVAGGASALGGGGGGGSSSSSKSFYTMGGKSVKASRLQRRWESSGK